MYKQSSKEIFKILPAIISAHLNGSRRVSAVELGELYDINSRTLNVTLQKLVQAGILHSQTGGLNPGYGFLRDPRSVSLYDISQVVCRIEYPRCSLKEHDEDDNCMVCNIIGSAVDIIVSDLKAASCYDFYLSLKDKMKL
ncbi:MAG: Rrf2 family transcriptional regulator [Rikenellaceae bacterium]